MVDQNTLGKVNQEVLQNRVNSLRNQKEEIRQRLQNPGLYPDSSIPNVSLSNINEFYRPSQAFSNDLQTVFKYAGDGSSNIGENTPNDISGPAMSNQTAQAVGNLAGLIGSYSGVTPSGFGTTISGALSGNPAQAAKGIATMGLTSMNTHPAIGMALNYGIDALNGKAPSTQDIAKNIGLAALFSAVPQARVAYTAYSVAKQLADVFGLTDIGGVFGPSDTNLGYSDDPAFQGNISFGEEQERVSPDITYSDRDIDPNYTGPKVGESSTDYGGYGFGELGSGLSGMSESDLGSESLGGFGDIGGLF